MTMQRPDTIFYNGVKCDFHHAPLKDYLKEKGRVFRPRSTACWRGYFATWEVADGKLYLKSLSGDLAPPFDFDATAQDLSEHQTELFSEESYPVFAEWFSGNIDFYMVGERVALSVIRGVVRT